MSTIKVNAIQNTSGVQQYLAKAWVNFNGTGTVAIRGNGNVASITDNGTGDYTVNFTAAMPDTNYVVIATSCSHTSTDASRIVVVQGSTGSGPTNKTTTSVRVVSGDTGTDTLADVADVNITVFR